jgi:RNA polymerase sigma factor for flagellar operon FliA
MPLLQKNNETKRVAVGNLAAAYGAQARRALTDAERSALIEAHLAQVKFLAERLAVKLPSTVELDDLIGAGVLGLLDAVDKFDPSRGVQFKTYAEMRVRGAMLDSLRDLDWASREQRRRARALEKAIAEIEHETGRAASEEEVAARMNLSLTEYHALLHELHSLTITELDFEADDADDASAIEQIADVTTPTPLALYESEEWRKQLASAIDALPPRERQVVALYYLEELTMKEIGILLDVTESRVSQLRTQAILRLRAVLSGGKERKVNRRQT